jgi:hypothetical protein
MRRTLLIVALTIGLILCLMGCASTQQSESAERTENEHGAPNETTEAVNAEIVGGVGIDGTLTAENFEFSILSTDLCASIKNAMGMEYAASDGKQFLLVVFRSKNISADIQNVMNVNFNSYIDDEKVVIYTVVGEVNGYMPLFGAVSSQKIFDGYTVWEVPDGWNKLEFSYIDALTGSDSDFLRINATDLLK